MRIPPQSADVISRSLGLPAPRGSALAFAADEQGRATRALQTLVRVLLGGTAVGVACVWLLGTSPGNIVGAALALAALPLAGAAWLARRGRLRAARLIVPLDMLALATTLLHANDGLQDIAILFYPAIVAVAGLLLGRKSFFWVTGLACGSLSWVAWGQLHGVVRLVDPTHRHWISGDLLVAIVLLGVTATVVSLLVDGMRKSLASAVRSAERSQESESRFRTLFDMSPAEVLVTDTAGRFRMANRAFLDANGIPPAQSGHPDGLALASSFVLDDVVRAQIACAGEAPSREIALRGGDGRVRDVIFAGRRVSVDGEQRVLSVMLDVTARKRAETAATRERTISNALIDSLPGIFYLVDPAGRFVRWNRTFGTELGYSDEEMGRLGALDVVAAPDRERAASCLAACFREGRANGELLLVARDGRTVPYFMTVARIGLQGGTYLLGTAIDLSDRKRLQEQLYRGQKMEAIGSLASGIAHDFNNLVFGMSALAELARRSVTSRPEVAVAHLDKLLQSVSRARDLVARMLAFGRRNTPHREVVDLRALAEEVTTLLRASCPAGIRVRFSAPPTPVLVDVDPSEIHQVVLNLGANAAHASSDGKEGTIDVVVDWAEAPDGRAGLARVRVRDNGHGIPSAVRHRIFDPYFTTKRNGEGTGLGLSVAHAIVSGAGGQMEVDSVEGEGTTVAVLLPAASGSAPAPAPAAQVTPIAARGGEKLALVDHEPVVAMALADALRDLGYDVEAFVDSRAARRAICATPGLFDLVLCDADMPRVSAQELARAVRRSSPGQRFLLLTGRASVDPPRPGPAELPSVEKNISLAELARVIRTCLDDASRDAVSRDHSDCGGI